jgi:hypothetical protein
MSDMEKAVEGGDEFIANQQAQYAAEQAAEDARVAALPTDELPVGTYATEEEALAYLDEARAAGKYPQVMAEDGSGDFLIEVPSVYHGYETVWVTSVSDVPDPNYPDEK